MHKVLKSYRPLIMIGVVLLCSPAILDVFPAGWNPPTWLLLTTIICGSILLVSGIYLHQRTHPRLSDERFVLHRLKSSRFGLVLGLAAIVILAFYNVAVRDEVPWDLLVVAASMAAGKLGAMAYYRISG